MRPATGRSPRTNISRRSRETFLVGFTTHEGTVTAADDWGDPARRMKVRPSLPGSFERLFHDVGIPRFVLLMREAPPELDAPRLQRAIGVIYRPRTERPSHYFHARVRRQFDALIHLDETRAVEPLDRGPQWDPHEPPETYPSGI